MKVTNDIVQNTSDYILTYGELLREAKDYRQKIDPSKICKYGIKILDENLYGFLPTELILIGAATGVGKSELAYNIAITNALDGKKVLLMALEGDIFEIAFRYYQREINRVVENPNDKITAGEYRFNIREDIKGVEDYVYEETNKKLKENLLIFNKKAIPTMKFLREIIGNMKDSVDLIIIDHLHYIELEGENENSETGKMMRELKTITDIIKKPIVIVSHVKKMGRNVTEPTIEDIQGSSNISKEATTIVMLNRIEKEDIKSEYNSKRFSATQISVQKNRAGIVTSDTKFKMAYDTWKKEYVNESMQIVGEINPSTLHSYI